MKYTPFDDAAEMVANLGPDTFMAKLDIKNAFTICPVKMEQWALLVFRIEDLFYVYPILPFGLRSAPHIFNSMAELLNWVMNTYGCNSIHYLDDYFMAHLGMPRCQHFLNKAIHIWDDLGIPLAEGKVEGPAQIIKYLGITIDALNMEIRLPEDKMLQIKKLLQEWNNKQECTKRELLSLIGILGFASKVVKPGRMFTRRLIDFGTTFDGLDDKGAVTQEVRKDIAWWEEFVEQWNGKSLLNPQAHFHFQMSTDASNLGMGGFFSGKWYSAAWPQKFQGFHINILELFSVATAILTWLRHVQDKTVLIFTDNKTIVDIWYTGSTRCTIMMSILRHLFMFTAKRNILIKLQHVYGYNNIAADLLSRLQVQRFKSRYPEANEHRSIIPTAIWNTCNI